MMSGQEMDPDYLVSWFSHHFNEKLVNKKIVLVNQIQIKGEVRRRKGGETTSC